MHLRCVTEIEGMAFAGCENLKEIKLPANMTSINYYAFADINGSASITVYGSKSDWDKVEKNDAELKNWEAGDMFKDDVLDVFDLIMMRKALVS